MRNIFRFLIGLGVFLVFVLISGLLLLLFSPVIIGGTFILAILFIIFAILFFIAAFFGFFWYMSRKEPDIGKSKNYSIKQGKEIK